MPPYVRHYAGTFPVLESTVDRNKAIEALVIPLVIPDKEMLHMRNMPTNYQMVPFAISTE